MYGGEQQDEQDENTGANDTGPDSEDSRAISELCLLEPDNKLWVPMTITGALGCQTMLRLGWILLLEFVFCPESASKITAACHSVPCC